MENRYHVELSKVLENTQNSRSWFLRTHEEHTDKNIYYKQQEWIIETNNGKDLWERYSDEIYIGRITSEKYVKPTFEI